MGRKAYRVAPRKIEEIRNIANHVRKKMGTDEIPMGKLIELLLLKGAVHVLEDNDQMFSDHAEARYDPEQHCVFLRQSDYESCLEDTWPRSKYTFWHEFGHAFLGHKISFARGEGIEGKDIKPYESSEWQADQFAAEILMPLDIMKKEAVCTVDGLIRRFGVSRKAAEKRIRQLRQHNSI